MKELFAIPCVSALITKIVDNKEYILIQDREKEDGFETNGLLEIPAGKIREYENIFLALRREVKEETGLNITKIYGEEDSRFLDISGNETVVFSPYCVTQNLSGAYSIILNTFLCEADGILLYRSDETANIRWIEKSELKKIVEFYPEKIFLMHIHTLRKYLKIK